MGCCVSSARVHPLAADRYAILESGRYETAIHHRTTGTLTDLRVESDEKTVADIPESTTCIVAPVSRRESFLRATPFALFMDPAELALLADQFHVVKLEAGEVLFHETEPADMLYIMQKGTLQIYAKLPDSSSADADSATQRCVAADVAVHEVYGLPLCEKSCPDFLGCGFGHGALMGLEKELTGPDKEAIQDTGTLEREQDAKSHLGVAQSSTTVILVSAQQSQETAESAEAAPLSPYWGRRTVTAVCATDVVCLALSRESLAAFLKAQPKLAEALWSSLGGGFERSLQQNSVFQSLDAVRAHQLSLMFRCVPLEQHEVLFQEWDFDEEQGSPVYFVYSGEVEVLVADSLLQGQGQGQEQGQGVTKVVGSVTENNFVGEVGMLLNMPRTATVRGGSSCLLLELQAMDFERFLLLVPQMLDDFAHNISSYGVSLKHLIHNPTALRLFVQYLESEFSAENAMFWIEARNFRLFDLSEQKRQQKAAAIVDTFIKKNATHQVNLNSRVVNGILDKMRQGDISADMFEDAENQVLELMNADSFMRFKRSDLFSQLLKRRFPIAHASGPQLVADESMQEAMAAAREAGARRDSAATTVSSHVVIDSSEPRRFLDMSSSEPMPFFSTDLLTMGSDGGSRSPVSTGIHPLPLRRPSTSSVGTSGSAKRRSGRRKMTVDFAQHFREEAGHKRRASRMPFMSSPVTVDGSGAVAREDADSTTVATTATHDSARASSERRDDIT